MRDAEQRDFQSRRFMALDAFRGIFCILIVFFHMRVLDSFISYPFFRNSVYVVGFFFMLSGFVIAHRYAYREELNVRKFIRSRFYRLFPLHLFMLCVIVGIECCKYILQYYNILRFNNPLFAGKMALGEIVANLFLVQAWTPYTNYLSVNYVSWSISVEFYIYIIFILIQVCCRQRSVFAWLLLSGVFGCCLYSDYNLLPYPAQVGLFTFFLGTVLYTIYKRVSGIRLTAVVAGILEILLVLALIGALSFDLNCRGTVAVVVFLLLILVFAFEAGIVSRFLCNRILYFLEGISYSVYLTHVFAISMVVGFFMFVQKL